MQSMSNPLPRLMIKRAIQDYITEDLGLDLNVEQTKSGVGAGVTVWITGMREQYTPVRGGKTQKAELTIEFNVFSQTKETKVHDTLRQLCLISPLNPRLAALGYQFTDITPVSSDTVYGDESTQGVVIGTLSLKLDYLMKF